MPHQEKRERIVSHAEALADTGHYSGWLFIQQEMLEANLLDQMNNPLRDRLVRLELDARCHAANMWAASVVSWALQRDRR